MPELNVCDMVRARAPLGVRNGAEVVPAIVTKVWDRTTLGDLPVWVVNLFVMHDGPEIRWRASVYVFETEEAASTFPGWNAWLVPSLDDAPHPHDHMETL